MVSIIIPARDEADAIQETLNYLTSNLKDFPYEIIVVDDHSRDRTGEMVEEISRNNPRIRLVRNNSSPGIGEALKKGFQYARGEYVVPVMADLCDDIPIIPKMYQKALEGYDIVCGSRYIPGGGRIGGPLWKGILSRWAGKTFHYLTAIPTWDITNAFKMYKREALNRVVLESRGFEISVEIPLKLFFSGARITEIPTVWRGRKKGKSKFSLSRLLLPYLRWLVWGLRKRMGREEIFVFLGGDG